MKKIVLLACLLSTSSYAQLLQTNCERTVKKNDGKDFYGLLYDTKTGEFIVTNPDGIHHYQVDRDSYNVPTAHLDYPFIVVDGYTSVGTRFKANFLAPGYVHPPNSDEPFPEEKMFSIDSRNVIPDNCGLGE